MSTRLSDQANDCNSGCKAGMDSLHALVGMKNTSLVGFHEQDPEQPVQGSKSRVKGSNGREMLSDVPAALDKQAANIAESC